MIVGFLGTLITLERAAAMGRLWPYGAPMCAVLSVLALAAGLPVQWAATLAVISSAVLCVVFIALYRQSPLAHFIVMAMSALVWIGGMLNVIAILLFLLTNVRAAIIRRSQFIKGEK